MNDNDDIDIHAKAYHQTKVTAVIRCPNDTVAQIVSERVLALVDDFGGAIEVDTRIDRCNGGDDA